MKKLIFTLFAVVISSVVFAQLNIPRPSPSSTVIQKVGLAEVSISYSRPSKKGRVIFGELVPFGKIWRTGANDPTKFTTTDTLTVHGKQLLPGSYALYTIPGESEWTIIFGNDPAVSYANYNESFDAVRFTVKPSKTCEQVETFTIQFTDLTTTSANVKLAWDNTEVKFGIQNEIDAEVMAEIQQKVENTMTYYQAASYYLETGRNLEQALEWVNKATAKDPKFWQLHTKAKIQAKLGDCKAAKETAEKSTELAKAAKNEEYVKMNQKLIDECKSGSKKK